MARTTGSRLLKTAAILGLVIGLWGATAWLARDVRPRAIEWTGPAFALCMAATYSGAWLVALIWARDPRLMLFRATGTTAVLLILVLILEVAALTGLVHFDKLFRQLAGEWGGPTTNFVEDPDFGFRRPPHSSWTGRPRSDMAELWNLPMLPPHPLTFTTDSRGFRNLEEPDRADVVLIGDSYVEGHYVDDRETAAAALRELVDGEVVNLGQSGYGSLQELEVLRRFGLPLRPNLVAWFFFEGNDLYDDQEFENMILYLREHETFDTAESNKIEGDPDDESEAEDSDGARAGSRSWSDRWKAFRKASFTRHAFRTLRRWSHAAVPNGTPSFGWYRDDAGRHHRLYFYDYALLEFSDYERERLAVTRETLRAARDECEAQGARLVVFFIPMKFRVYQEHCSFPPHSPCTRWAPWDLAERFAAMCEEEGIALVDLTPPMRVAAGQGRLLYAPEDSHWNAAGHRFVAERVREAWRRLDPDATVETTRAP
jgi:hypothetical protein